MFGKLKTALNREDGQALFIGVLVFAALVMSLTITLDFGTAYGDRARVQAATDSAAIAASQALSNGGTTADAIDAATNIAAANGYDNSQPDTTVTVNIPPLSGPYAGNSDYVEVIIDHEEDARFAQVFNFSVWDINARAVSTGTEPFNGLMPWAVLESAINYDGTPTVLKYDSNNGSNGNYGALRLFGNGSNNYENNIKYGVEGPICALSEPDCTDPTEQTEPGNMIGGTRDGVNYRIANTSTSCDEFNEVFTPDGSGGFNIVAACNSFEGVSDSMRVLLVPVVNSFCNGTCTVTLQYFTLMFLNDLGTCKGNSCEVTGTFVQAVYDPSVDLGIELGQPLTIYLAE